MHLYNIYTLLGYNSPVEFPNWREFICEEVGSFIERTEIQETKDQILACPRFIIHLLTYTDLFTTTFFEYFLCFCASKYVLRIAFAKLRTGRIPDFSVNFANISRYGTKICIFLMLCN